MFILISKCCRKNLVQDWKSLFKEFDTKPFAAASIGQVHRGLTHDGIPIAVKVQVSTLKTSFLLFVSGTVLLNSFTNSI